LPAGPKQCAMLEKASRRSSSSTRWAERSAAANWRALPGLHGRLDLSISQQPVALAVGHARGVARMTGGLGGVQGREVMGDEGPLPISHRGFPPGRRRCARPPFRVLVAIGVRLQIVSNTPVESRRTEWTGVESVNGWKRRRIKTLAQNTFAISHLAESNPSVSTPVASTTFAQEIDVFRVMSLGTT